MAENKKGFILYADQQELVESLSDENAGQLIKHIFSYVNDEQPETDNQLVKLAFISIRQQLKRDLTKWIKKTKVRSDAGKKGMESRWKEHNKAKQKITNDNTVINPITNITVNDNVNVTVNVKDILNKRKAGFKKSLHPFLERYGSDLLNEFYGYWTEHNPKGKKMRFEYSKNQPFDINRRLQTWFNRRQDFKKEKSFGKKEKVNAGQLIQQVIQESNGVN